MKTGFRFQKSIGRGQFLGQSGSISYHARMYIFNLTHTNTLLELDKPITKIKTKKMENKKVSLCYLYLGFSLKTFHL